MTAEQKEYARLQIQRIDAKAKARKQARENENAANPQIVSPVHNDSRPQKSSAPFWVVSGEGVWF